MLPIMQEANMDIQYYNSKFNHYYDQYLNPAKGPHQIGEQTLARFLLCGAGSIMFFKGIELRKTTPILISSVLTSGGMLATVKTRKIGCLYLGAGLSSLYVLAYTASLLTDTIKSILMTLGIACIIMVGNSVFRGGNPENENKP